MVVAKAEPAVDTVYQARVDPVGGVANRETLPEPHLAAPVAVGKAGRAFTVANTAVRVADTQPVEVLIAPTKKVVFAEMLAVV